jgi:uncharacterized protein
VKRSEGVQSGPFHVKRLVIAPIRTYKRLISPGTARRCKYEPSCSTYAVEAIERFGVIRGLILATWRVLRCNPFSHGGFDPVRDHFSLRGTGHVHPAEWHGEAHS